MAPIIIYFTYTICIIGIVADLASIYFINHIWSYRKHKFIQSRSPTLTYSVLWIFFSLLLLAICNAVVYPFVSFWNATYFFIINDAIQYGCTFAYATRAWILFYHVEWSYESVNHVWRTQLAEADAHVSKDVLHSASFHSDDNVHHSKKIKDEALFWIDYRDSLGNWKKVFPMTMGLLFPLFLFLLDILPYIVFNINRSNVETYLILRIVNILCYLVIFLLILTLIRRIHKISDKYDIGHELKSINICFAVFILIGRIGNGILAIVLNNDNKLLDIMTFIAGSCTILSILCSVYIGSFFVLRHFFADDAGSESMKGFKNNKETCRKIVTICKAKAMKDKENDNTLIEQILTLNQLLSTQYGFETFTQFLISELSVENMLFLVEVKQYKACCRKYHKDEKIASLPPSAPAIEMKLQALNGSKKTKIDAPKFGDPLGIVSLRPTTTTRSKPNVFKSKSIMNVDYVPSNKLLQTLGPYEYAMYLYHKYVIDGSDLQINIPSRTKKMLTKFLIKTDKSEIILLDDYTDQMFKLYDKAWEQIHTLIKSDSYSRFKYTQEYHDLCIRAKEEDDKKAKEREEDINGHYAEDFLITPKPSILDWEYNKMVMVDIIHTGTIHEDYEDDIDMKADLEKLNSITGYAREKKTKDIYINDNEAMDVLNDIPSWNENDMETP